MELLRACLVFIVRGLPPVAGTATALGTKGQTSGGSLFFTESKLTAKSGEMGVR